MARRSTGRSVLIRWTIENFNFCWHKTGERLESPSFSVTFSSPTTWRLWLYPRGEDDGEYVSFFLFREEGGQKLVHIHFQLCLYVSGSIENEVKKTFNGYSFNSLQRGGQKCFASRWKLLAQKENELNTLVLCLKCIILNPEKFEFSSTRKRLHTRVEKEHIYGTEIFDDDVTGFYPTCSKEIGVKPMLENGPLININLDYFEDSLVIKILPVNCKKIKYAICKITAIKNWEKEVPIERFRSWIGEINGDLWKFRVSLSQKRNPEKESSKLDIEKLPDKVVFVRYDFAFSTGEMVEFRGMEECSKYLNAAEVTFKQYLNAKPVKSVPTALESLEKVYRSESFSDAEIETGTDTYPAHKAILCVRSPILKSMIEGTMEVNLPFLEDSISEYLFFLFLYTDVLETVSIGTALQLYKISHIFEFEPLKLISRNTLRSNLNSFNATKIFHYVWSQKDEPLRTYIKNYITAHYESVISFTEWENFANEAAFRKELIYLKYQNKKAISQHCIEY